MNFNQIKGQKLAKILIEPNLNNLPSMLFYGMPGIGKSTMARMLANSILGSTITHPDRYEVVEVLKIEEVRNIIAWTNQSPAISNKKVAIIHDCDTASHAAFQALLKVLEESNTVFILTTSNIDSLPRTIPSRLTKIPFLPLTKEELIQVIGEVDVPPTFPNSPGLVLTLKITLAKLNPHISLLPPRSITQAFKTASAINQNLHDATTHKAFALYLIHLWYHLGYFDESEIVNKHINKLSDKNPSLIWEQIMILSAK
ncbi:MAG: AAA family ATPase [Cyanobacteria bacterium P01_A01_bin.84]